MKVISVSDVHIKYIESEDDLLRKQRFISFLKSISNDVDVLILNGDIFDLWIEWELVSITSYSTVVSILKEIADNGCRIIYLCGNHDFWLGSFLKKEINAEIYPDTFTDTIDGLKYFVAHGDQLTINDLRYHIFRAVIRLDIVRIMAKFFHPEFLLKLGSGMSRSSRKRTKSRKLTKGQSKGLTDYVQKKAFKYDIFLMGHVHDPQKIEYGKSVYINTGDWIVNNTYAEICDGIAELKTYKQ